MLFGVEVRSVKYLFAIIPFIIVLIVVIFNSILGYINGQKKTIYYIIVDLVLTLIIIGALSLVTVQKYYTTENMLEILEKIFTIPDSIKDYFVLPELNQFIYLFTDILVRILLFIGIITITKWIFKFGVFKPMYPRIVNNTNKTKKDRKKGAVIGSLKGLVLGLIFIIPIFFLDSSAKSEDDFPFVHQVVESSMTNDLD